MNCEYTHPKMPIDIRHVEEMHIVFDNGDFVVLTKREILQIDLRLYDRLTENDLEYSPVAESGFIECQIAPKAPRHDSYRLYDDKAYRQDRKAYIEDRCVNQGAISCIYFFNEFNWSQTLFGDVFASIEDDRLILRYRPNEKYGPCNSDWHTARIGNITTKNIDCIELDFENCDSLDVFDTEIKSIQLIYDTNLKLHSSGFTRELIGGYILLKLDPEITWRHESIFFKPSRLPWQKTRHIEKRLFCAADHSIDICNLYVTYTHAGSHRKRELISVRRTPLCYAMMDAQEDDTNDIIFFSGYAFKRKDGSILIRFGDRKKKT